MDGHKLITGVEAAKSRVRLHRLTIPQNKHYPYGAVVIPLVLVSRPYES